MKRLFLMAVACALVCRSEAQNTSSDVLTILRASLTAQAGSEVVQDVTLVGTAESIADSDETAHFSFKGTLSGAARTDINLSSGALTETRTAGPAGVTGTWSRGGGKQHSLAGHNLMTDPAWCSPVLVVEHLISNSETVTSYVSTEAGVAHFRSYQPAPASTPAGTSALISHLSQIDLFLDTKTFLPVKLSFTVHPDNNALVDLPVLITYSSYQTSNGVTAPMRIQKYLNGSLALDVEVNNAVLNSGLTAATL